MAWKNININSNQIETDTGKSVLIKMPNNSEYAGYMFWHPSKLVRNGRHSASYSLGYTDEFIFKLKKYGNGKWNKREVIHEIEISAEEFEEAFGVTDRNISSKKYVNDFETHKPEPIEAVEVEVENSLKDE